METTHIGFPPLTMAVFVGLALAALLLDMVTHRDDKPITLARASIWSVFWVAISLAFAGFLYVQHGAEVASLFVTGYALEKVLSVDNLFVFMAISPGSRYRMASVTEFSIGASSALSSSVAYSWSSVPACSHLAPGSRSSSR